jgi:predicted pyridoxine 5'-phosphate oxidase superfamily flavin-nucleotide-binding protein
MLTPKIYHFLKKLEFINVATCDFQGRPNAAPKLILKCENNFIYLIDYTIGKTWSNITKNPKVSLSFAETDNLMGYQVNGSVEIIDKGLKYKQLLKELSAKEISLSAERIIRGIRKGKKHEIYEVEIPKNIVIFKVEIEEFVEIGPKGELIREGV